MPVTFQRRTRAAFVIIAAATVFITLLAIWSSIRFAAAASWSTHTLRVLHSLDEVVGTLSQAESEQRGYLITRDPEFLDRFKTAAANLDGKLDALRSLTLDNSKQQQNIAQLTELAYARMAFLRRLAEIAQTDPQAAFAELRTMRGVTLMQSARDLAASVETEETHLLDVRLADQRRLRTELWVILGVCFLSVAAVLLWARHLIAKYNERRDDAESAVRKLNAELEERVEQRTAALVRSNRDLEHFAYVASHDLQEPLRTISSFVQLLQRRYLNKFDQDADTFVTFIVDASLRMQQLIQDLLMYSRASTQSIDFKPVDTEEVLGRALGNLKEAIEESHAKITHDPLPNVIADAMKLTQVFQNLVGNSIKFRGEDVPRIHVSARRAGKEWEFSVRDNGIGLDTQYADKIFVIFQRLHAGGQYSGTGIGLAFCKRVVEGHGGRIWVESRPGEGATFFFTLPVSPRNTPGVGRPPERKAPVEPQPETGVRTVESSL